MRILNIALCAFMALFAAVQYNDSDGPLWAVLYGVPALWTGLAGVRPALVRAPAAKVGLAVSFALYLAFTVYCWPTEAGWWRIDIWWESEETRESMGLMIATAVITVAGLSAFTGRARPAPAGRQV